MIPVANCRADVSTLMGASIIWDNHACLPIPPDRDRHMPMLDQYIDAGVDIVSINIGYGDLPLDVHLDTARSLREWVRHDRRMMMIDTADDIALAARTRRLGVTFDVEGLDIIDPADLGTIKTLRDLGVRWMLMAYNHPNAFGGGCYGDDGGLTAAGRDVLAEMKLVGIVPCCSHTGHRTAMDVMESADMPVIFSHSNPGAVYPHARNIGDDLIRACASTGGVVGINGIGSFLGDNDGSTETFIRHVDHVTQLVGPEHVSIALDFMVDTEAELAAMEAERHLYPDLPADTSSIQLIGPERMPTIVGAMLDLGYGEDAVKAILGAIFTAWLIRSGDDEATIHSIRVRSRACK